MKEGTKRRMPAVLKILLAAVLAAVLCFSAVLIRLIVLENRTAREVETITSDYDAIIVLGAQVRADGTPSVQLSWRLDKALEAYRNHPGTIVVCGAQGADEPMPEAVRMRDYLLEGGVSPEQILTDDRSTNTEANLKNAAELLKTREGIRKVLIVTSDYHLPRAMALARDQGYDAVGLGSPTKPEYWLKNHARETLAWVKYWLKKYLGFPLN